MVDMRWVPTSKPLEMTGWSWCSNSELENAIDVALDKTVTKTLASILAEKPPCLDLPIRWAPRSDGCNGPAVSDRATIYLSLPFGNGIDNDHVWTTSLVDMIEDAFWPEYEREDSDTERYEPSRWAQALAARLRELADLLERGPDDWGKPQRSGEG